MNKHQFAAFSLLAGLSAGANAQSSVTVYGRIDLSIAQQADAPDNKELRNGSSSRIGFRGVEDLQDGLRAVFQLEHRFNADDGTAKTVRFWEGKSIVGLEGWFGRVTLGREENPAYTFSQSVADPWDPETVASNGTIVNGRIGTTRYSNSVNYRVTTGDLSFGAQVSEANGNPATDGALDRRPYSLGLAYVHGPWRVGAGYENPAGREDSWATINGGYDFGTLRLSALYGVGKNVQAEAVHAYLISLTAPLAGGQLRASYGQLKNKDIAAGVLDKQIGLGYHYLLSKRTTVYADLVSERRDNLPVDRRKAGYALGIKHTF